MSEGYMAEMNPSQPYMAFQTSNFKKLKVNDGGISHFYEFSLEKDQKRALQAVPDGTVDLLFGISSKGVVTSIGGTVLRAKPWEMEQGQLFFGVCFQPGKCVLPKDLQMKDIIDTDVLIDGNLFGDSLTEQLASSKNLAERAQIFRKSYQSLLRKPKRFDGARELEQYIRRRIYQEQGNISIASLSEETGYSACYIRRVFGAIHGISPKVFEKFVRFQNLLDAMEQRNGNLEQMAMSCGYYDQSHMIKDFKCYTGMTPEAFIQMVD